MVRKLKTYPNLYDELEAQKLNLCLKDNEILLPFVGGEKDRIIFTIHEYDPLLDSSNIQPKDWCIIADDIRVCKNVLLSSLSISAIFFIYRNIMTNSMGSLYFTAPIPCLTQPLRCRIFSKIWAKQLLSRGHKFPFLRPELMALKILRHP